MKSIYKREVARALRECKEIPRELLTEKDIAHLPEPVQKYLRFAKVLGRAKVDNVFIKGSGRIRSKPGGGWMKFYSEQQNFFKNPFRAFYLEAYKMGIPAFGLHLYKDATASMVIKLLGLFKVVDARGPEMDQGETVTVFNDMCFMAPASLIDKNIAWEPIDPLHVNAVFKNGSINIRATLVFDSEGKLVNFISPDRFETTDGKLYLNYIWETPVVSYGTINGCYLPTKANVVYKHPEGDFCYLEFEVIDVVYNKTNTHGQ